MLDVILIFKCLVSLISQNLSFRKKVMDGLHSDAVYEELVSVRLVGMMLTVVVKQEIRKNIIRYSTQSVGTGALNFMVMLSY